MSRILDDFTKVGLHVMNAWAATQNLNCLCSVLRAESSVDFLVSWVNDDVVVHASSAQRPCKAIAALPAANPGIINVNRLFQTG